jgi:TolA-binding protein
MIVRLVPLLLALAVAPLQCTKAPDDSLRREDTAGDGLWLLAEDFKAKGDEKSYRATLRFLVTRYPSSRRSAKARTILEETPAK